MNEKQMFRQQTEYKFSKNVVHLYSPTVKLNLKGQIRNICLQKNGWLYLTRRM